MATRTVIIDDYDGTEDLSVRTRTFMVSGEYYALDLSDDNYEALIKAIEPFMDHAVTITRLRSQAIAPEISPGNASQATAPLPDGTDATTIREWAAANGITVRERGRIPASVVEKYSQAHAGTESIAGDKK